MIWKNQISKFIIITEISFFLISGCSNEGEELVSKNAKCDLSTMTEGINLRSCAEYPSLSVAQSAEVKKICVLDHQGSYLESASCNSSDTKGKCLFTNNAISFSIYYYNWYTPDTAKSNCEKAAGSFQKPS